MTELINDDMIQAVETIGYDPDDCICEQMIVFGEPVDYYTICTNDGEILGDWNNETKEWIELYAE